MALILLLYVSLSLNGAASQESEDMAMIYEWRRFVVENLRNENYFTANAGDSIVLNCSKLSYLSDPRFKNAEYKWTLMDLPLRDEGEDGHVQITERGDSLSIDDLTETDSGVYTCHGRVKKFVPIIQELLEGDKLPFVSSHIPVGIFIVRVEMLRSFAITEGEVFRLNASLWLQPFAESIRMLKMSVSTWRLEWRRDGQEVARCKSLSNCTLSTEGIKSLNGQWSLDIISKKGSGALLDRREVFEFKLKQYSAMGSLNTLPTATHQLYIVCATLTVALFLLSLHLFINMCWIPFVYDLLPQQLSISSVLRHSGEMLQQMRVRTPPAVNAVQAVADDQSSMASGKST